MTLRNIARTGRRSLRAKLACVCLMLAGISAGADSDKGEQVYGLRPQPEKPRTFGHIGPSGILAHIEKGVRVTIEGTREGSPADGKFKPGEVIVAVNGQSLEGVNPYVALGSAITAAEAADGELVFGLESKEGPRTVTIQIPVLGAYSPTWPVECRKSERIIRNATAFYSKWLPESGDMGIPGALACLFLLSTGDDAHLPVVAKHFQRFLDKPNSIGSHTWNNGYNGVACAEYYLRTGDKRVLPILQAICDDARDRQCFDSAWKHWGDNINPAYVGGGLMNPASAQVLTTLLLCKEVGVDVDETTLHNALRFFWRFVGHGSIPYGDHRGEGGVSSNGKNAMVAAAMQVATGAVGDTSIYESARDYLSMANLNGYPGMILGHADNGRGDALWRGVGSFYLMQKKPELYHSEMNRISWWYDLTRFDDGALGVVTCPGWHQDVGSGAGVAMAYTAPLKTLRITGAPRSKYARTFTLPKHLWGNEADLVFHSIDPVDGYEDYGQPLPMHKIAPLIGTAYRKSAISQDPSSVSTAQLNQFIRHGHYMIRAQAAIALRIGGHLDILEELLKSPDPRLRRAALDGIIDWRYFFATGKQPMAADQFTPGMIESITGMLSNREESIYVMEGALFAVGFMPTEAIAKHVDAIMPWTQHEEWWLRYASFMALQGLASDPALYAKVLPTLTEMMVKENHTMPRQGMNNALARTLKKVGPGSEIGLAIVTGFQKGVAETQVLPGPRGREGKFNITETIGAAAKVSPETAPEMAKLLIERGLPRLDDDELLSFVSGGRTFKGFLSLLDKLEEAERETLEDLLYTRFRPEVSKRLQAGGGTDMRTIDTVLGLIQLRDATGGWKPIGSPQFEKRTWRYTSLDPTAEKDILPKREGRRYREIELPAELDGWFNPEFDDSSWNSGQAPIGKGGHPRGPRTPTQYPSAWGDGEILLARTTFDLDRTDFDMVRLRILCGNGFIVYLNGRQIRKYTWWAGPGEYRKWAIGPNEAKLLKKGTNTLAVYAICAYPSEQKPHWKNRVFGELNAYIESLDKEDLY